MLEVQLVAACRGTLNPCCDVPRLPPGNVAPGGQVSEAGAIPINRSGWSHDESTTKTALPGGRKARVLPGGEDECKELSPGIRSPGDRMGTPLCPARHGSRSLGWTSMSLHVSQRSVSLDTCLYGFECETTPIRPIQPGGNECVRNCTGERIRQVEDKIAQGNPGEKATLKIVSIRKSIIMVNNENDENTDNSQGRVLINNADDTVNRPAVHPSSLPTILDVKDNLFMRQDNLVHFIPLNCIDTSQTTVGLLNRIGFSVGEVQQYQFEIGNAMAFPHDKHSVFFLFYKNEHQNEFNLDYVEASLKSLKPLLDTLDTKTFSILIDPDRFNPCALEKL